MGWEYAVLDWIQSIRTPFLDRIMVFITSLGDKGLIWILIGAVLLCTKKYRSVGLMLLITLALEFVINDHVMKPLVERQRPYYARPDLVLLIEQGGYSFPSGHTASSFASAAALYFREKKAGLWAFVLAALIGFSRLYMYVHFPTDVLAGALLGVLIAWAVYQIETRSRRKKRCQRP